MGTHSEELCDSLLYTARIYHIKSAVINNNSFNSANTPALHTNECEQLTNSSMESNHLVL